MTGNPKSQPKLLRVELFLEFVTWDMLTTFRDIAS